MKLFISMISLAFVGISTIQNANAEQPKWVNNPDEYCPTNELCAVGEATGRMGAEAEARKSLSSIFQTKIKASTKVTSESSSSIAVDVVEGSATEEVTSTVKAMTEQVLEGVEITQFYEDSESVYALAVLNKPEAAKRLKSKINDVDEDIRNFYKDGRRGNLNKALKQFAVRQNLNERYEFLSSRRFNAPISKAMILKKKREKAALGTTILLKVEEVGSAGELQQIAVDNLLASDYKVVMKETLKHDYVLDTKLKAEKEYFNVKGFEKYKFILAFEAQTKNGKKHGSLETAVVQTGRDFAQAYNKAIPLIRKYIADKFDDLNID
jgi:hypothetical protein